MIQERSIIIKKIWEDVNFFQLRISFFSLSCNSEIDIYTTNEELENLREGIIIFSNFKQDEFIWLSGNDSENVTHYLSLRFFLLNKRGHVGIEVIVDNKEKNLILCVLISLFIQD